MTQNTEQGVRSREEQISSLWDVLSEGKPNPNHDSYSDVAAAHIDEAEARGAAEQRRKDGEGDYEAKDEGANYVLKSLAAVFGCDGFDIRDGSESWEGDVHATLCKLLDDCGLTVEGEPAANVSGIGINAVIQAVSELPDRTSPEDQPDLLTVTAGELRLILSSAQTANVAALEERITELAEAEQLARADAEASKAREKVLEEALRNVRLSIEQADPKVLCCTLWMAKLPETVVDYIDASLTREGGL